MDIRPPSRRPQDQHEDVLKGMNDAVSDLCAIPNTSSVKDHIVSLHERLNTIETSAQERYLALKEYHERLNPIVTKCRDLQQRQSFLLDRKKKLSKELACIESEIDVTQTELDSHARRRTLPTPKIDAKAAIYDLESRIRVERERLSRGLAELLIITDGEFVYPTPLHLAVLYMSLMTP